MRFQFVFLQEFGLVISDEEKYIIFEGLKFTLEKYHGKLYYILY